MAITPEIKQCGNVKYIQVTVDGEDLTKLKGLLPQILVGNPSDKNDGLLDQVSQQGDVGKKLSGLTKAAAAWVKSNSGLYNQLQGYYLQPKVKECKSTAGEGVCDAANVASPDLPLNLQKLAEPLSKSGNSFTYNIYNQARPMCAYFGLHQGLIAFTTPPVCQ